MNGIVHNLGQGGKEIAAEDLGVEEDLRAKESLITNIDGVGFLGNGILASVLANPLGLFRIVFGELLDDIGAYIAVLFLHSLGYFHRFGGGNGFSSFPHELLHESGDITTGKRNVFDTASNYVSFSLL